MCYLYSVHAGLHLQLLHGFPGLRDAGCAVVSDVVLHDAAPAVHMQAHRAHHEANGGHARSQPLVPKLFWGGPQLISFMCNVVLRYLSTVNKLT